jgi:hypothetical protein
MGAGSGGHGPAGSLSRSVRATQALSGPVAMAASRQPHYPGGQRSYRDGRLGDAYYGVHPELGTVDDLDELIAEAAERLAGMYGPVGPSAQPRRCPLYVRAQPD